MPRLDFVALQNHLYPCWYPFEGDKKIKTQQLWRSFLLGFLFLWNSVLCILLQIWPLIVLFFFLSWILFQVIAVRFLPPFLKKKENLINNLYLNNLFVFFPLPTSDICHRFVVSPTHFFFLFLFFVFLSKLIWDPQQMVDCQQRLARTNIPRSEEPPELRQLYLLESWLALFEWLQRVNLGGWTALGSRHNFRFGNQIGSVPLLVILGAVQVYLRVWKNK